MVVGSAHHADVTAPEPSPTAGAVATDGAKTMTHPMVGASSSMPQMVVAATSPNRDGNAIKELDVVMGHPSLRAQGQIFLSEAMSMAHFYYAKHGTCSNGRGMTSMKNARP
jgi:hypothetical protein